MSATANGRGLSLSVDDNTYASWNSEIDGLQMGEPTGVAHSHEEVTHFSGEMIPMRMCILTIKIAEITIVAKLLKTALANNTTVDLCCDNATNF